MKRFFRLLAYLIPYKWYVVQNIVYNILGAFFALFSFAMVIPFLQVLFGNQPMVTEPMAFEFSTDYLVHTFNYRMTLLMETYGKFSALILVSVMVILFSFLKNGFHFLSNYVLAPIRARVVRDIRNEIYRKVLQLPLSYFTEARKGDVIARISSDVQEIEASILSMLSMFFRDPITIIIFMAVLFTISFKLTLFVLILLPVTAFVIGRIARSLRRTSFRGQERLGELLALIEETLLGLRIIKAFNGERKMEEKFYGANRRFTRLFNKVMRRRYMANPVSEFLGTIVLMVIMAYGGSLVIRGGTPMTSESLILFLVIFSQVITPAKSFANAYFNIQKGLASVDRVDYLLEADVKITEKKNAVPIRAFRDSIVYRNVSFRYDDEYVLKNINLTIKKGQTVALVGRSGAGKTTLVDLLPRFMDVSEGEILIDGIPVQDYRLKDLRSMMGIVSQQSILFNDSFYNNIAFGTEETTFEEVEYAARVANAHEFIAGVPGQYEAGVGEGGSRLSGGQQQRISIARAVLANPPILILDEATSSLDTESEKLVQDAIIRLMQNRTSIVIAHRLSTIKHADLIVVLDEGEMIESGKHEELINIKNGVYRKLHRMQMF
ncbi:MAG: ATP-binding cassette domain-containing protein [Bacteroidales bacterium]|nr:ATP-binding cassette domain-containing protein [Bacteroidales bacterium]